MKNECDKCNRILKGILREHAENLQRLGIGSSSWEKSDFIPVINSLYHVLKAYKCDEIEKILRRVSSFKRRMLFMKDSAVEEEAKALANELFNFVES